MKKATLITAPNVSSAPRNVSVTSAIVSGRLHETIDTPRASRARLARQTSTRSSLRVLWLFLATAASVLGLLAGNVIAADAEVASISAAGTAGFPGKTLGLKSSVVQWKPDDLELKIGVFPVETTPADAEKFKETQMMLAVIGNKKMPDPKTWPSVPYLMVAVKLKGQKPRYDEKDIASYMIHLVKWKGASTIGVILTPEEIGAVVQRLRFSPGQLKAISVEIKEVKDRSMAEGFRYTFHIP
jgi:hypothetical protein